jgi:hypothetical protein
MHQVRGDHIGSLALSLPDAAQDRDATPGADDVG